MIGQIDLQHPLHLDEKLKQSALTSLLVRRILFSMIYDHHQFHHHWLIQIENYEDGKIMVFCIFTSKNSSFCVFKSFLDDWIVRSIQKAKNIWRRKVSFFIIWKSWNPNPNILLNFTIFILMRSAIRLVALTLLTDWISLYLNAQWKKLRQITFNQFENYDLHSWVIHESWPLVIIDSMLSYWRSTF